MKRVLPAVAAALLLGCEDSKPYTPLPVPVDRTPTAASDEPAHIVVQHVLVAFAGATRSKASRSKEEAKKLAEEILQQSLYFLDALERGRGFSPG